MTSGGSARTCSSPAAGGASHTHPVEGKGLSHLRRDQVQVVVDEQQVGHGPLGSRMLKKIVNSYCRDGGTVCPGGRTTCDASMAWPVCRALYLR